MTATAPPAAAPDSEQQIIGVLLIDPDRVSEVTQRVQPGDFTDPYHKVTYRTIRAMHLAGEPVDAVALLPRLKATGQFSERFSAASYLYEIGEVFTSNMDRPGTKRRSTTRPAARK